jgi:parallel beta-helix repeat protein
VTTTSTTSTSQPGPGQAPDAKITGRTYYVSPSGNDSNSGLSPSLAWRTVDQVNRAQLQPGDGVLFQGGATFSDDLLMPGWGTSVSGTSSAPVVFGSYGTGQAYVTQGIWTKGESYLVFQDLQLGGPVTGLSGTGSYITLQNSTIKNVVSNVNNSEFGIVITGSYYTIRNNTIDHTGDSGILVLGDHHLIEYNSITNTSLDAAVTWGAHGIYLKSSDSSAIGNTISGYQTAGISIRYRNSVIENNTISGGPYGLCWHQYDTIAGTSHWLNNRISTTNLGIYISPSDVGGPTIESFVISGNTLVTPNPKGSWQPYEFDNTSPVSYTNNTVL